MNRYLCDIEHSYWQTDFIDVPRAARWSRLFHAVKAPSILNRNVNHLVGIKYLGIRFICSSRNRGQASIYTGGYLARTLKSTPVLKFGWLAQSAKNSLENFFSFVCRVSKALLLSSTIVFNFSRSSLNVTKLKHVWFFKLQYYYVKVHLINLKSLFFVWNLVSEIFL